MIEPLEVYHDTVVTDENGTRFRADVTLAGPAIAFQFKQHGLEEAIHAYCASCLRRSCEGCALAAWGGKEKGEDKRLKAIVRTHAEAGKKVAHG